MEKEFITIHDLNLTKYKISREGKIFSEYQKKIRSDNKLENLEWVTSSENMKHAYNF